MANEVSRAGWLRRHRWKLVLSPFLLGCLCCSWLLFINSSLGRAVWANWIPEVEGGKVKVIVPAQRNPRRALLFPDGSRMFVWLDKPGLGFDLRLIDLVTGEEQAIDLGCYANAIRWLSAEWLAIQGSPDCYEILNAKTLEVVRMPFFLVESVDDEAEVERLRRASTVYVLETFGYGGYTFIALDEGQWYAFLPNNLQAEARLLAEIPHTLVPRFRQGDEPVYSPDGLHYATALSGMVEIRSVEGKLLASATKPGWGTYLLGWAHDGKGVYFQTGIRGAVTAEFEPRRPVFKLTLMTKEELRWDAVWRAVRWVAAGVIVVGIGWWMWKRRWAVTRV